MIDELPTRAALAVAAFTLLATGLSVLSLSGGDSARGAAVDLAARVARGIDAISAIEGETSIRGGVGSGGAFTLPPNLAGASYVLEIHATRVCVVLGGTVAVAPLRAPVHPFAPSRDGYTGADLRRLDTAVVMLHVGDAFLIERLRRAVDAVPSYLTFVHLP